MDRLGEASLLMELLGEWTVTPGPLYRKLSGAMTRAIRSGDVPAGERLPSERDLAKLLTVSRATVVAAYDELRGAGLIDSRRGSGTRVNAVARSTTSAGDGRIVGGRATSIFQRLVDGPSELISLAFAVEPAAPEVGDALRSLVAEELPGLMSDLGYHPRGYPPLRTAVAEHFSEMGLPTTPDQILVTTGAQQVIGLVAQMYLRPGSTVVVESPSWPGCLDIFRAAGAQLVGVPLDDEGVRPDGLAAALAEHRPALVYLMPTYHNPTGTLMSAGRRNRVAELCSRYDVPLIEDNAYASFPSTSGTTTPPPVAAYVTTSAEVLTVGSLAKSLWGGLRIGWVRGPAEIIERLVRYKARADLGSPVLDQALAARLIPDIAQIAVARSSIMAVRLDHLRRQLTDRLPTWRWQTPDGGSALWILLPDSDAHIFAQVALRHGVEVVPGSATDPTGGHDAYLRLPFTFPIPVLTEIVERLSRAWHELLRHGPAHGALRPFV